MSYLLTIKAIELINSNLKLDIPANSKEFNILIYVFEHYNEIIKLDLSLDFYLLLKFYGHCDYFMLIDFIKYISRKIFNHTVNFNSNINPFIINNYPLFSDIIKPNLLNNLNELFDTYKSLLNGCLDGLILDYMVIYNKYIKNDLAKQ
jgi:hypothetical protein